MENNLLPSCNWVSSTGKSFNISEVCVWFITKKLEPVVQVDILIICKVMKESNIYTHLVYIFMSGKALGQFPVQTYSKMVDDKDRSH